MIKRRKSNVLEQKFGLRVQVALGVALPVLIGLVFLSLFHYQRERMLLDEQARTVAGQIGEVIYGSLRHSMLSNDQHMIDIILEDVVARTAVTRVRIVGLDGVVVMDTVGGDVGQKKRLDDAGCVECHQYAPEERPKSVRLRRARELLRIAVPIPNEKECQTCHDAGVSHLGMVVVDAPPRLLEEHAVEDLFIELAVSALATLVGAAILYLLLHWLVVRRVALFNRTLDAYARGDFSARVPVRGWIADESDTMAVAFNRMADQLERHVREEEQRYRLRQQAIIEERERIALELHDGLAQLIGYVNTKVIAIRLLLKERQIRKAETNLRQLEEAAHRLSVDVREAILGLKMAGKLDGAMASVLREYVRQFTRLSDLPVELTVSPEVDALALSEEARLQIFRIMQEALSNVRKHAEASLVKVVLDVKGASLQLVVEDNGKGFDPELGCDDEKIPHFGLCAMRERAEAIGGALTVESEPGRTRVVVTLPLRDGEHDV